MVTETKSRSGVGELPFSFRDLEASEDFHRLQVRKNQMFFSLACTISKSYVRLTSSAFRFYAPLMHPALSRSHQSTTIEYTL